MITVAEAREIIVSNARPLAAEPAPIEAALGRTLRERVVAQRAQPPFAASAMDGYAVRSADTPGRLRLVGEAGAGHGLSRPLQRGECARIFTGAPIPEGADSVLIQEDAERDGDTVVAPSVRHGLHVRAAGVDFERAALLLEPGRMLDAAAIALAAAAGRADLSVARRPRVALLSGGDEIVPPGVEPAPDQIFDSVSYGLAALIEGAGGSPLRSGPLRDDAAAIAATVADALTRADLLVLVGGASVGDHDHARPALRALGAELLFEKVALRPGKPTWFARCEGKLVLGLPGNPASAFVCSRLFLRPLLDSLLGRDPDAGVRTRHAKLRGALAANGARETYLRARLEADSSGQLWVSCAANQDSSLISVFANSNALVRRSPQAPSAEEGELVEVIDL